MKRQDYLEALEPKVPDDTPPEPTIAELVAAAKIDVPRPEFFKYNAQPYLSFDELEARTLDKTTATIQTWDGWVDVSTVDEMAAGWEVRICFQHRCVEIRGPEQVVLARYL